MALGGHPHDPSSSPSSIPTDPPTPIDTSTSDPTIFQPGRSPPLILAFIALGFLGVGAIILFGYKRINSRAFQPVLKISNDVGCKPMLWDIRIDESSSDLSNSSANIHNKWTNITPLSVTFTSFPYPLSTPETPPNRLPGMMPNLMSSFTRRTLSPHGRTPIALEKPPELSHDTHKPNMLVAVLVSMPSPTRCLLHSDQDVMKPQGCEYHVGLMEVSCIGAERFR